MLLQAVVAEDEVSDHSQSEACGALKPETCNKLRHRCQGKEKPQVPTI